MRHGETDLYRTVPPTDIASRWSMDASLALPSRRSARLNVSTSEPTPDRPVPLLR